MQRRVSRVSVMLRYVVVHVVFGGLKEAGGHDSATHFWSYGA